MSLVDEHLAAIAGSTQTFYITLGGADTFRPVTPTVFLRIEDGAKSCELLAEAIRSGPLRRRLQFPYHPHVTWRSMLRMGCSTKHSPSTRATR